MEHRYIIVQVGCVGVRDQQGREIPSAIISGTLEAIRALGPVVMDLKGVRILLDLEEEAKPEPPPPSKPELMPVWQAVFPGLEAGERVDGTLWHRLDRGSEADEAMLTMGQEGYRWFVDLRCVHGETRKVMGPPIVWVDDRDTVDLRHDLFREWGRYVNRYSEGAEYSNEQKPDGSWGPRKRTEDLWTVKYVERAIRGME